jgi:hypothetical protein
MACECYRSAPQQMPNCTGSPCAVSEEWRQCSTKEGRDAWMARYRLELAGKAQASDAGPSRQDSLRWLHSLGLPGAPLSAATNPNRKKPAMAAAERWWTGNRSLTPALVLPGPVGVGKSTAACWVCLEWASSFNWRDRPTGDNIIPLAWMDNSALTKIGGFDGASAHLLDVAERAHLLVLDDAGKEHTRPAIEALTDVLRSRIDNRRLTVLTTNATGADFRKRYGEALADRLRAESVFADLRNEKSMRGAA